MTRAGRRALGFTAFMLAAYPFLVSFHFEGPRTCFSWFAADAFFYLTVAKRTAWEPLFSFDGLHATNGFHPLWQVYLKAAFSALPSVFGSGKAQLLLTHATGALCVAASAVYLTLFGARLTRNAALALLAAVPGFTYFLAALIDRDYGSLWSFANGMESPFSLLLFGLLLASLSKRRLFVSQRVLPCVLAGALLSLLVLTRLDDVFLVPALLVPLFWRSGLSGRSFLRALALAGIPALVVLAYMGLNLAYAGSALPVSGQLKGGLAPGTNLSRAVELFAPFGGEPGAPWRGWGAQSWRALFNAGPVVVAFLFLSRAVRTPRRERGKPGNLTAILTGLSVYVLLKGLYNFVFVASWHQGHWYFPLSIATANLLIAAALGRTLRGRSPGGLAFGVSPWLPRLIFLGVLAIALLPPAGYALAAGVSFNPFAGRAAGEAWILAAVLLVGLVVAVGPLAKLLAPPIRRVRVSYALIGAVLLAVFSANALMAAKAATGTNARYYRFWTNREAALEAIEKRVETRGLLSFDDGILGYSLETPVMSGLGLALDREGVRAKREGRLLELAYARGFRCLASLVYLPPIPDEIGADVGNALKEAFWLEEERPEQWRFRLIYVEPESGCKFIAFEPAGHASSAKARKENP